MEGRIFIGASGIDLRTMLAKCAHHPWVLELGSTQEGSKITFSWRCLNIDTKLAKKLHHFLGSFFNGVVERRFTPRSSINVGTSVSELHHNCLYTTVDRVHQR